MSLLLFRPFAGIRIVPFFISFGRGGITNRALSQKCSVDCKLRAIFSELPLPGFLAAAKREENLDKILFIGARNYYTVVDKTLNEWNEWQMRNINVIVWLYRG